MYYRGALANEGFLLFLISSKLNTHGVEVGLGPLLAALRGQKNKNGRPYGGLWGVFGRSWGRLGGVLRPQEKQDEEKGEISMFARGFLTFKTDIGSIWGLS